MTDEEIIEAAQGALEVESRAELEHVLICGDCYLFDSYDGGAPHYCLAFRTEFRGYVPRERMPNRFIPDVWSEAIRAAMQTHLVYGASAFPAISNDAPTS